MQTNRRRLLTATAFCTLASAIAAAPDVRAHDAEKGPNGGQMIEVKGHHVELTAEGSELTLYLSDGTHAPVPSKGASGRAVILEGSKQSSATLTPAEPNRLLARLDAPLGRGARVVVTAKLGDGHDIVARFVMK
jgi:hypothetical protein